MGMRRPERSTPTYQSWAHMIQRCTNPNNDQFADYGGRGISVCDRWRSFDRFLADMGERPEGTMIERIDNDGSYEPGNCRWATRGEQQRNRRNNRMLVYQGETLCVADLAARHGMSRQCLAQRLNRGWSLDRALTT